MKYRTFTLDDQAAFAELSGDFNPLHIDPLAARRTLFGAPVVHGIHALLWSLDSWLEDNPAHVNIRSIKAVFPRPIRVGDKVTLTYEDEGERHLRIELSTSGALASVMNIRWNRSEQKERSCFENRFPERREPQALSGADIEGLSGTINLCLHMNGASKMFPQLALYTSLSQIAVILCTTRLVGVECPGLHSMYSELNLRAEDIQECTGLKYEVVKFDKRFGLAFMNITAPGMSGVIKAFVRPPQHDQAAYNKLRELVKDNEFEGQRAIVIGGSRGLGEVVSKLLAAGAAEVRITYNQGEKDAEKVSEEINANGGIAASLPFNVLKPDRLILDEKLGTWQPTHLYYFATPFIFAGAKGIFSPELFTRFCDYYITGFLKTLNCLRDRVLKSVYCPSTVAIDELPIDMGEYSAAKAAAEALCSFLEKSNNDMIIHRPRLPRMSTDQTVSLLPVKNNDPVPIMLEHLRHLRDASAS